MTYHEIRSLCTRITLELFGKTFNIRVAQDLKSSNGRTFIQIIYLEKCNKGGEEQEWRGRKWYLSEYMIADEIVKTVYAAWEACILHEVKEGMKVDNIILFNPHLDYMELLAISEREVKRN